MSKIMKAAAVGMISVLLFGCGGSGGSSSSSGGGTGAPVITELQAIEITPPLGDVKTSAAQYIVLAWNDLGMHCLNPSYDTAVILPPYNTIRAQVIQRGNKPSVVTSGVTVSYQIINNSSSQKGLFSQFWTYAVQLFGATPTIDKGLNLDDPTVSNGLTGNMLAKTGYFIASGIPLTPVNDGGGWNPYQLAEVIVKDSTTNEILAKTRVTVPTSDEINCGKCHAVGGTLTQVFEDILNKHDSKHGTTLKKQKPVLCSSCHSSPALNGKPPVEKIPYLSQAIHNAHAPRGASCYDCHPGNVTKCNRSTDHTAVDGNCTNISCHGTMANVASTIASGDRIPWVNEPKCVTCHDISDTQIDTGTTLYRNAIGHGGVQCSGCHGSPHAMAPSNKASDNYQSLQYQGVAMAIGDCRVCHDTSKGGGSIFAQVHNSVFFTACNVCHTGFQDASITANWPHQFKWKSR
jgi:predicted CxxxxCH...CXXCH cytochrome family protein